MLVLKEKSYPRDMYYGADLIARNVRMMASATVFAKAKEIEDVEEFRRILNEGIETDIYSWLIGMYHDYVAHYQDFVKHICETDETGEPVWRDRTDDDPMDDAIRRITKDVIGEADSYKTLEDDALRYCDAHIHDIAKLLYPYFDDPNVDTDDMK